MPTMTKSLPIVNQTYSAIRNSREEFRGKVTSIRDLAGGDKLIRLEDPRGNYQLYRFSDAVEFVDPADAPKAHIPTPEDRAKERCEYFSTYTGGR